MLKKGTIIRNKGSKFSANVNSILSLKGIKLTQS